MEKLILKIDCEPSLQEGLARLQKRIPFALGECGIPVTAGAGESDSLCYENGRAVITYRKPNRFFRQLGILVEHLQKGEKSFSLKDDGFFECLSTMIDTSRCGVPTVEAIFEMIDYLALMGYDMAMLYTEDTVKLPDRPYFGYMRGRYELSELRAIDDYAFAYGIEVIPCLECYGHMEKYLIWKEARPIKDTDGVLMAREEKTFEFIEHLMVSVSSCFRSKRIHIGMDEAWDMGRGKFLDQHGYVPPFTIFTEYMDRLMEITRRHGLQPMMWSDMYFRISDPSHSYYGEETQIPPQVAALIPEDVELVFWHYGEKAFCDDYMLKKHRALGRKTVFAGGLWSWCGHFPEHRYTMETTRFSLEACRNNGVKEAMATVWSNDNAEGDLFANLFGLSFFAELCYDPKPSEEKLRSRFTACTGGDYDAFLTMGNYHNNFDGKDYPDYSKRFLGKPLFWQDILEGLFDTHVMGGNISGHYAASCERMKQYQGGRWDALYRLAEQVFDYLAVKTLIAENLVPAYQRKDRDTLTEIARVLLPLLKEKTQTLHLTHRDLWMEGRNLIGWCNLDIRYAGVEARCDTAMLVLQRYLAGKDPVITALEEPRLYKPLSGFIHYSHIATPNIKT